MSTREAFDKRFGPEPKYDIAADLYYTDRDLWLARWDAWQAAVEAEREAVKEWRSALLGAWANDHRAVMTALLEMGPRAREDKKA